MALGMAGLNPNSQARVTPKTGIHTGHAVQYRPNYKGGEVVLDLLVLSGNKGGGGIHYIF